MLEAGEMGWDCGGPGLDGASLQVSGPAGIVGFGAARVRKDPGLQSAAAEGPGYLSTERELSM